MIWVAGRSPTLVSHSLRGVATNLKATTLAYLAITALHQDTKSTGHLIISPRQEHEINFGEDMVKMLPENGIAVGDRSKATLFSLSAFQLEMGRKPSCRYETQYKLCYDHAGITISFQEPCSRSRMPDQSNP
jgi:hypothetical protein